MWDFARAPLWEKQGYAPLRYKLSRVEAWGLGGDSGLAAASRARTREATFQEQRRFVDRRKLILGDDSTSLDPRVDEQRRKSRMGKSNSEKWQQSTEKQMLDMLSTDFRGSTGGSMM